MTSDRAAVMAMAGVASARALRPALAWPYEHRGGAGATEPTKGHVRTTCRANDFSITGARLPEEVST